MGDEGERFDLVVIGSGPAGEKAAAQAAYFGKRVAIVERRPVPGGAAVSDAVIPSKTLRETALYLTGFRKRNVYGVSLSLDPDVTLKRLTARRSEVVSTMSAAVARNLEAHGIEAVMGTAALGPGRTVSVRTADGERTLEAGVVLIATGSRPYHPPGIPFEDPDVADSQEIMALDRIPSSLVVVGGGVIGCEYASIFTALETDVTLVDAGERLIPALDGEISRLLADTFTRLGIRVITGVQVEAVERIGFELTVRLDTGEIIRPDRVLVTRGQIGNTDGLNLAAAGVDVDGRGRVMVDERYRTTAEGIYAAGDVIGSPALASTGMEQGRVAICHAFGIPFKETVDPLAPFGVYTIPEVAMVGLSEEAARAQGIGYEIGRGWFAANPRATIAGFTEGLVKLVFRRDDRVLLGVHILGEIASELIHLGQAAIADGHQIDRFIHATFNVPTRSDAYKYAAYDGLQRLAGMVIRPEPPAI